MDALESGRRYWETTGATKDFTHPVHAEWLAGVDRAARILDYGCGYGRVMAELSDLGFGTVTGADVSAALIARGGRARPDLSFELITSPPVVDHPAASFDVIVLFAVLTCVPGDADQRALVAETHRLLAPGGLLHVSDLLLQADERSRRRYAGRSPYGVFTTGDGAVCRHHDAEYLRRLLADFDITAERHLEVPTMNGNRAAALQLLARRR
ncbi:class I SAM-dependent methyltransferase [Actinoplanes ianthinogenes]|uniref:Methyltransferase n=1 Tax=Actinoplanes ianthinogenes TaxID=122358 RepID=A0ABN6CRK3_9ACTN|nr:class I SAM-dependent methyltransferase [Actinoplanes ianthinogenes]BCJ47269.1 hypothetical protein Aiant_79260 [Actinoplanes ianthinogenes]